MIASLPWPLLQGVRRIPRVRVRDTVPSRRKGTRPPGLFLLGLAAVVVVGAPHVPAVSSIPSSVVERSGLVRQREPLTSGVPLPRGTLHRADQVRLLRDGQEVPAPTRTRHLDGMPFRRSLQFDIGLISWKPTTLTYAAATYWDAFPGATANIPPQPDEAARPVPTLAEAMAAAAPPRKPGALEREAMAVLAKSGAFFAGAQDKDEHAWAMGPFVKRREPVLSPVPDAKFVCPVLGREVRWAAQNVYNPAAVVRDGKVYLFYRADDRNPALKWGRTCRIGMAWSEDGTNFIRHPAPVLYPDHDAWKPFEWEGGCEDLHVVEGEDGVYYMNYTTWSGSRDTVSVASSRDLLRWTKHGPAFRQAGKIGGRSGVVVSRRVGERLIAAKIDGKYWMYYTHPCALAWSENLIDWTPTGQAVWPGGGREAGAIALLRDDGILLMTQGGHPSLGAWVLRQALIDRRDLKTVRGEQKEPCLWPEYAWEKQGFTGDTTVANALVPFRGKWWLYYGGADRWIGVAVFTPQPNSPFSLAD